MEKEIYLVRHGETLFNYFYKMQGWSDTPLTKKGVAQAQRAGRELAQVPFDLAIASDLGRAVHTCREIVKLNRNADQLQVQEMPEFREVYFGSFEGMDGDWVERQIFASHMDSMSGSEAPFFQSGFKNILKFTKDADPYHVAENYDDFWRRLDPVWSKLRKSPAKKILVVSHGLAIRLIADRYGDGHFDLVKGANGAITRLILTDDDVQVKTYAEIHLPDSE